jgi:leucyl-tRNA synthetase
MMIFLNLATKKGKVSHNTATSFAKVLSPFAPHVAEELWSLLGNDKSIAYEPWPDYIEEYLHEDNFEYPVSFNGKLRFSISLPVSLPKDEVINSVLADDRAKKWLGDAKPANIIFVPKKIVNIVIKNS